MRPNLTLEPVDGADAEPYFPYHFANPDALGEFAPRKRYLVGFGTGAPQLPAHLPSLAHKLAVAGELFLYDAESRPDTLADHRALEFGEALRWRHPVIGNKSTRSKCHRCGNDRLTQGRYDLAGAQGLTPHRSPVAPATPWGRHAPGRGFEPAEPLWTQRPRARSGAGISGESQS